MIVCWQADRFYCHFCLSFCMRVFLGAQSVWYLLQSIPLTSRISRFDYKGTFLPLQSIPTGLLDSQLPRCSLWFEENSNCTSMTKFVNFFAHLATTIYISWQIWHQTVVIKSNSVVPALMWPENLISQILYCMIAAGLWGSEWGHMTYFRERGLCRRRKTPDQANDVKQSRGKATKASWVPFLFVAFSAFWNRMHTTGSLGPHGIRPLIVSR